MADLSLGKLEHLDPRTLWKNEAGHFTPWLADHLLLLGEAIGLDLQLEELEGPVGDFSCDIVAREAGTNRPVIVENQLERTDHSHLGQLLTYAAGLDAGVVIWISSDIREEHREALHWLNRHTDEQIDFFGIRLEAIRIDGSKPAIQFNLVVSPNKWGKAQSRKAAKIITGSSIPALKAHRTRLMQRLETASESERPLILERIAEYDRRIAEAEAREEAAAQPLPQKATMPSQPETTTTAAIAPMWRATP